MTCTALSLAGVLSALLDYSFAHGAFRTFLRGELEEQVARLASGAFAAREQAAAVFHADTPVQLGAMTEMEPSPILTPSMTSPAALPPEDETPGIARELKADRIVAEVAVAKLTLPEPEPIGEGASAALFLLSPSLPAPAAEPAPASPPVATASPDSQAIVSGPVAAWKPALPVRPPMQSMLVTSATTAAAASTPAPQKYGWSELMRMASMKGGDGEEPAKPFGALSEKEFRARELRCMATAIYFEARGETVRGQIAVGQVIMNRVRSDFYPKTICGVVFQGQWNRNACQFSFACDGATDAPKEKEQWATALDVAKQVISGKAYLNDIADATHYHAVYVRPDWRRDVTRIKQIGVHIFYKAPFVNSLASLPDYSTQ